MSETTLKGIPASDGIVIGPAFCHRPLQLEIPSRPSSIGRQAHDAVLGA
jgi:hypothetical protein